MRLSPAWVVRIVIVAAAAVVLSLHFTGRLKPADAFSGDTLSGTTSQGETITLWVRDGEIKAFEVTMQAPCEGGAVYESSWAPGDGLPVGFERSHDNITVEETRENHRFEDGSTGTMSHVLHGTLSEDESAATGDLMEAASFQRADGTAQNCATGPVAWSAER